MPRAVKSLARTGAVIGRRFPAQWLAALLRCPIRLPLFDRGRLAPGWSIERRTIRAHLIYFVVRNACQGQVGDQAVELAAGSFLWVPPGLPFEFTLCSPHQPLTLLRFRLAPAEGYPDMGRSPLVLPRAAELHPAMDAILDELSTARPHREAALRAQLVTLFAGVFRLCDLARPHSDGPLLTSAQRRHLADFASRHIRSAIAPGQLAAEVRLSPDYFSRAFRRSFGLAPRLWLARERIRHAAALLLDSTANVSEVAQEFGYPDVFAFSRQFKNVLGRSPREFRRTH